MKAVIGIILHSKEMDLDFSRLEEQLDCKIYFMQGVMEYAIGVAEQLEREYQVNAIISSAATARVISSHVSVPVVPLYIDNYNLIDAFARAGKLGSSFAFIDITEDCIYNLDHISTMLGYNIKRYDFHDISETENVVQKVVADRREVVVTAANCMYTCARRNHLQAVLVRITEQDIISAVDTAKKLLAIKEQEIEKSKWLSAVVDNSEDGLLTVDQNGVITLVNSIAQKMIHIPFNELLGQDITSLAPHSPILKAALDISKELTVVRDDAKEFIVSQKAVTSENGYLGSVIRIRFLKELQETELFARKKIFEHGFVAQSTFDTIIGKTQRLIETKRKAQLYAKSNSTVLILGESGSGKELFAQSIHNASLRQNGPFVAINCATLPENLLDSELFGYEGGAFTGAKHSGKPGLFELSHGGTLFLDEIGELPIQLQSKLLRVLQEKCVRRMGGSKNIPIDVRVIFATNRDLAAEVAAGHFREDLYYRINILTLLIPPLRERKDDIPLLLEHFFCRMAAGYHRKFLLTQTQCSRLKEYDWPGNVRELYNFSERLLALQPADSPIEPVFESLLSELDIRPTVPDQSQAPTADHLVLSVGTMKEIELAVIKTLLDRHNGNKREVEQILDMSSTTLWRRIKETQG